MATVLNGWPTFNFPGKPASTNIGLVLNGGVLDPAPGNAANTCVIISGTVSNVPGVTSYIFAGGQPVAAEGAAAEPVEVNLAAALSGSGTLVVYNGTNNAPRCQVTSAANTFTGTWLLQGGWLQGVGDGTQDGYNSLGTNSTCAIVVTQTFTARHRPVAAIFLTSARTPFTTTNFSLLDLGSNIMNSAGTLTISNNGQMWMHGNYIFSSRLYHQHWQSHRLQSGRRLLLLHQSDQHVPQQLHRVARRLHHLRRRHHRPAVRRHPRCLSPRRFRLNRPMQRPTPGATFNSSPALRRANLSYQWYTVDSAGGIFTAVANGINHVNTGATGPILSITNITANNATNYALIATSPSNSLSTATSSVVSLTVVTPGTNGYETNLLAVAPANLVAYWRLNETTSPNPGPAVAYDYWGGFNGVYGAGTFNGANGVVGPVPSDFPGFEAGNTAVQTVSNGINAYVTVPALNINTNTVTIMAWIYPYTIEANGAGIFFCRAGATVAGLDYVFGTVGPVLGYTWANEGYSYSWNTGITPPVNQWSMAVVTITTNTATSVNRATVSLYSAGGVQTSNSPYCTATGNNGTTNGNPVQNFDGVSLIGCDANNPALRTFQGVIDEVAVFNTNLSPSQVSAVYAKAAGVDTVPPFIQTQPASQTAYAGRTVQFSVNAINFQSGSLTYQWAQGTSTNSFTSIAGATSSSLTLASVSATNAPYYVVMITNSLSNTISTPALLTVLTPAGGSYESNLVNFGLTSGNNLIAYWRLNETDDTEFGTVIAHDYWGGFQRPLGSPPTTASTASPARCRRRVSPDLKPATPRCIRCPRRNTITSV